MKCKESRWNFTFVSRRGKKAKKRLWRCFSLRILFISNISHYTTIKKHFTIFFLFRGFLSHWTLFFIVVLLLCASFLNKQHSYSITIFLFFFLFYKEKTAIEFHFLLSSFSIFFMKCGFLPPLWVWENHFKEWMRLNNNLK